ncbi:hypothetical protein TrLO_g10843 [Triparma laevis f. longispina]|uniref:PCI domain-containing protein n=1 Tax=Triparma laevis f. longispina TaxID=1714387 RepID=A0A9W7FR71_9STRA|nr:hypothetical protein TrLO_g10843 [Triparma laevis f. longispina]
MNSDGQFEEKKDLTGDADVKIPQADSLAASTGGLASAIDLLMGLEKQCRVGNDLTTLKRVVLHSVQLCKKCGDYEKLIDTLNFIVKRRSQKNAAITEIVKEAIGYVDEAPDEDIKIKLVICLRDITDGRIYVEAQRARLTLTLSKMHEAKQDIEKASAVLQEVHVETYGSLSKREKLEFILEQIRLTLAKKDWVRAYIVSQKVNRKVFADEGFGDLKIRFFTLMVEYFRSQQDAFQLCTSYNEIFRTPSIQEDEAQWKDALKATVVFLLLSPYSPEQQTMLYGIAENDKVEGVEGLGGILKLWTRKEIIRAGWGEQELLSMPVVSEGEMSTHWDETMQTRVVQHNIRVVSGYYQRIQGKRLAELLSLSSQDLEKHLSNMVSDGDIYAKIDRPNDLIRFSKQKSSEEILSDWASDITSLLNLVEATTHSISKEMMV